MLLDKVIGTINKNNLIDNGDKIVVGISGGPDSVCLLHILVEISGKFNIKLIAVHVDHMLRGEEAENDRKYVEKFCRNLGIPLFVESYNIMEIANQEGIGLEEAGREIRYKVFQKIADQTGSSKIAVAHNKNDRAETVLMNIIRGTGLEGLKGIDYKNGNIIRPLLDIERKEIEEYCRLNSLEPRIDSSNLKNIYTRNKIRLDLIPIINSMFNTNIVDSLCRMSLIAREDNELLEENAMKCLEDVCIKKQAGSILLNSKKLADMHPALAKRVIRQCIKSVKGDLKGIESEHINRSLQFAKSGRTGACIQLPHNIRIKRIYDTIEIFILNENLYEENANNKLKDDFEVLLEIPGVTEVKEAGICINAEIIAYDEYRKDKERNCKPGNCKPESILVKFFDYGKLNMGIYIRNRRTGDVFRPFKSSCTKKLKKYFIDEKIPVEERNSIPLIAKGNEIIWIVGDKINDKFKVTDNTNNVLKLAVEKFSP